MTSSVENRSLLDSGFNSQIVDDFSNVENSTTQAIQVSKTKKKVGFVEDRTEQLFKSVCFQGQKAEKLDLSSREQISIQRLMN